MIPARRGDIVVSRSGARFLGRHLPCSLGRGGTTRAKREGDGATPVGAHQIVAILYRADRLSARGLPRQARPIGPVDLWSDDAADPAYNHHVRVLHGYSHERLRRADPQYDLVLVTDWNWPQTCSGHGSAIFTHQWRRPRAPTAGCIGLCRKDLHWLARHLTRHTRLIVRP